MSVSYSADKGRRRAPSISQQHIAGTNIVPFPTSATGSCAIMSSSPRNLKVSNVSRRMADSQSQSPSRRYTTGLRSASLASPSTFPPPLTPLKRFAVTPAQPNNASTATSKNITTNNTAQQTSTILSVSTSSISTSSSSASLCEPSIILGDTRSRKISSAQEVAAKCRAVWAMREKLDMRANKWAMDDAPRWGSAGMMGGMAHGYRRSAESSGGSHSTPSSDVSIDIDENLMSMSAETGDPTLMEYPAPLQLTMRISANQVSPEGIPWPVSRYLLSQPTSSEAKENRFPPRIDTSISTYGSNMPPSPKARRRQSRIEGLERVMEEATLAMIRSNLSDGRIRCPRDGCMDILKSVKAVAFHLHIHDIHDRLSPKEFPCDACGGTYESPRELRMHDCDRHRQATGAPPQPFKSPPVLNTSLGHVNLNLRVGFTLPIPLGTQRARSVSASASGRTAASGSGSQHWGPLREGLKRIVSRATRRHDPLGGGH